MFLQAPPTVNWTSNSNPITMVPVGPDVLALLANNIVVCYNLKTEDKSYFKADNPQVCAGISSLTGHIRYPLFAVAEAVLQPRIFVISYPEMEKLTTIYVPEYVTFIDIRLSDFDYLATLGDCPEYKLSIWNFRTGDLYADAATNKKCSKFALMCLKLEAEVVMQYSNFHNQILIWQLCHSGDQYKLIELAIVDLTIDFILSDFFPMADWENDVYVVNDYGNLFAIDDARTGLKTVWSTSNRINTSHSLFATHAGFIVINSEVVYFITKTQGSGNVWSIIWTLQNTNSFIKLVLLDSNNHMHAATTYGNIYRIQHKDQIVDLIPEMVTNCYVMKFAFIKGIKDEVVLLLTKEGDLRMVEMVYMHTLSNINFKGANSICAHNSLPIVAVGTDIGEVYFINYEKVGEPVELGFIDFGEVAINRVRLFESTVLVKDEMNGLHVAWNDYKNRYFELQLSFARELDQNWNMLEMFILDPQRAIVFLSYDIKHVKQYATEAWIYNWETENKRIECAEYELPHKYRDITMLQQTSADVIEFMAARLDDAIVDLITIHNYTTMAITYSFKTVHLTRINFINGSRNILTADTQTILIHFRRHKKAKSNYMMSRALLCLYVPNIIVKMEDCFNTRYLLVQKTQGRVTCYRLPLLVDCLQKNSFDVPHDSNELILRTVAFKDLYSSRVSIAAKVTEKDLRARSLLVEELRALEQETRDLINYDLSVNGLKNMNFGKFCLNEKWLKMLKNEAHNLCDIEYGKLRDAVTDQSRIRDWIFGFIRSKSAVFSTKLRSLFSNIFTESFSTRTTCQHLLDRFDLFRFYDMEPMEYEIEELDVKNMLAVRLSDESDAVETKPLPLKRYVLEKDANVYEHVMAKDFELQDTRIVTFNQLYNEEAKQPIILINALKAEFNKIFLSSINFKEETIENVYKMNASLERIYSNMNCMLCLLDMERFVPPILSVPVWQRDENIQQILTVDESEIKATNRRKKVALQDEKHSARILTWGPEFFQHALMVMMDGVVEKIWEEIIKQTPPIPEFMLKKREIEFTSEEEKLKKAYENSLKQLELDRKKYLSILYDNEQKSYSLKDRFISKLNEHVAAINTLKMKYDFAIKHERLRLLNMKLTSLQRIESKNRIVKYRDENAKIFKYIQTYEVLLAFFQLRDSQYKEQYDAQYNRNRQLHRQFKLQFLSTVPLALVNDLNEIYKKRPKLASRMFSTGGVCLEVAHCLFSKTPKKFPLPPELLDFLGYVNSLDSVGNCPAELDHKLWEIFTKLRRRRIESELRLKGISYYMNEAMKSIQFYTNELKKLGDARVESNKNYMEALEEYADTAHNQRVEIVLSLGQVELNYGGDLKSLKRGVLLHVNDINEINRHIRDAGIKKVQAMKSVALFRRRVTQQEWKHKMARANIEYLRYILNMIPKCRVTYESLEVLHNWSQQKEMKSTTTRVGVIEDSTNQRLNRSRRQLERIEQNIDEVRYKLNKMKRENSLLNKEVEKMQINVTYVKTKRDTLAEEKEDFLKKIRTNRLMRHGLLAKTVRSDYIKILELKAILELTRNRSTAVLPPIKAKCISID